jgi:hypothetical protein
MDRSYPLVDEGRIRQFEQTAGITLPADYRDFLLAHNGGHPVKRLFDIPEICEDALLDYFLAIDGPPGANLGDELARWKHEMPTGFLPIAGDPGGAILIMGTVGEHAGKIYFWDHQHSFLQSSHQQNTYLVGTSFSEFLSSLKAAQDSPPKKKAPEFSRLVQQTLERANGILPIQLAQLAAAFSELPNPRDVVANLLSRLFDHDSFHVRRVAVQACRRAKVFDVPGLRAALIEKLVDPSGWVRYDAAWAIREAGYDGADVRSALAKLADGITLPEEESNSKNASDAEWRARVEARKALDRLLAGS